MPLGVGFPTNTWVSSTRPAADPSLNDALRVNLARTAVEVVIPERDRVLLEVVAGWKGLEAQTSHMLREVHHQFVGWPQALDDLHARAMGDFAHYDAHPKGADGVAVFCELYAKALAGWRRRCAPTWPGAGCTT